MSANMRRQNQRRKASTEATISHPPVINGQQLRFSTILRFTATAAAYTTITYQNILDTILVATSTTTGSDVFQAVKVRRVEIWGMPAIGSAGTVSVEFSGAVAGSQGDQQIHTDTSMGVQPAHVAAKPSRQSLASMYQTSSSAAAFNVRVLAGSVVDVHVTFRGHFASNISAQNALALATAGAFYLRGLDGLSNSAPSNFPPDFTNFQI